MRIFTIISIALIVNSVSFSSCTSKTENTQLHSEQLGSEYTSAFVCPMHCEGSGGEEPGSCPVCSMEYVAIDIHNSQEHQH